MKNDELISKTFFKKYKIIKKIGKGSFGLVYLGEVINSGNYVAVKFESKKQQETILERESYLLYYLKGFGIPEIITYGHNSKYNILVQTLLGSSINEIFHLNNKRFCLKDCCMIGIQMIDRLEFIHSKYIIHRDIKPDNFLIGNPDTSLIYLIDFGLAKKYMSSRTGKHLKFSINKKWSGTSRFASANTLRGVVQSRRDDLESLCYILLFIMKGSLPWDNIFGNNENEDILLIYKIKKFMKPELLFLNLPKETAEFFKYCKNLDFEKKPDYNYLRSLLMNILNNQNNKNDLNFSWKLINNEINNQREVKLNQYNRIHKRKNSPQQRIYNSLINNKIKISKRSESYNDLYINKNINKVKRNCERIKNISPSPTKTNNLLMEGRKEINKNKIKYIKKIPNGRKRINISNNNNSFNDNIVIKTQTEIERIKNKKINIINLQKIGDKPFPNNNNEKENNNIIKFKTGYFFNNSTNNIKDEYNKNIIRKNTSNNTRNIEKLYNLKIPNFKMYKKLANNSNIHIINAGKKEDKNNYNIKYNTNALENINYNQKQNLKTTLNITNSLFDKSNKNTNKIKNDNKDNAKIYNENLSLNYNNNKIVIPKNLKINHLSPEQYNRYRLKLRNEINNNIEPKKQHNITYGSNKIKLSLGNKKILNNFNIIGNNKTFINTQNINKAPMKNIKIINIISPINKIINYYKVKKNSFCSKTNLYKTNDIMQIDNSNNKDMANNFWERKKNDLLFDYYSNSSLIDKSKQKNNNLFFNYENFNNQYKAKISKSNSYFINNKLNTYNRNNFINNNLNKNNIGGSFNYISPKLIEKYKTGY